uniref:Uncharacterized protein n=1 Tax=Anguilla anguilla TaxID=7936 RepID=A0A0E9WAI3_ANGAN
MFYERHVILVLCHISVILLLYMCII